MLGIILYVLLNWSYTTAVFTDPGSTLNTNSAYSALPTSQPRAYTSLTVKSTGTNRFCKKCQAQKPDRAHHCSTCRRCVLKMDHHCPWLATCVGLRNYKPFLLFLIYTSLFCWVCLAVSATWVWSEMLSDGQYQDTLMPVNYILLAVLSGIIGLVLTGFTAWHIYLACNGRTTIESLEKTRYLSPLKRSMQQQINQRNYVDQDSLTLGEQLREIHANALPGVTRPEEGEERSSPAQDSLQRNWNDWERQREHDRYSEYLDEQDSEKLPNAFDLGWRRNLKHVMGENLWFWALPVCNTTGDGWEWEPSSAWLEARDQIARVREAQTRVQKARERETQMLEQRQREGPARWNQDHKLTPMRSTPSRAPMMGALSRRNSSEPRTGNGDSEYEDSSDEERSNHRALLPPQQRQNPRAQPTANWNDVPDDFLSASRKGAPGLRPGDSRDRSSSRNRRRNDDEWQEWGQG